MPAPKVRVPGVPIAECRAGGVELGAGMGFQRVRRGSSSAGLQGAAPALALLGV